MRRTPLLVLAALLIATAACSIRVGWGSGSDDRWSVTEVETLTLPAADVKQFQANNDNGALRVTGMPESREFVVKARKVAYGRDEERARAALRAMRVEVKAEGDRAVLAWRWDGARPGHSGGSVGFDATIPAALALELTTQNGAIVVGGCTGRVTATSHNGSIQVTGGTREVALTTHNGEIEARLEGEGPLAGRIESHNGSIEVALGPKVQTQVIAGTENGRIRSHREWAEPVAGRNYLVGTIGASGTRLQIEAHNGAIALR